MPETPLKWETREAALQDTISLLDLAIRRSWASKIPDPQLKRLVRDTLEGAKQELVHLKDAARYAELTDREGSAVWGERRREVAKR